MNARNEDLNNEISQFKHQNKSEYNMFYLFLFAGDSWCQVIFDPFSQSYVLLNLLQIRETDRI